jgi:hypothetical protein
MREKKTRIPEMAPDAPKAGKLELLIMIELVKQWASDPIIPAMKYKVRKRLGPRIPSMTLAKLKNTNMLMSK